MSTETTSPAPPGGIDTPYAKASYRYFVLGVLTLVYALNFVDRQLLVILQEQIKLELDLSDTQLGLLSGLSFAIFYVVCGIPIARWADTGVRRNIIALALTVWSGMTAVSGLAQNYLHLLLARVGVGVGEAGGSPPAHSMISDIFPEKERATALSIYSVGIYIGILTGFALGGFIAETFGWRMAFFVVGAPGILVALFLRPEVEMTVAPVRNPTFVVLSDGSIRNTYDVRLRNKHGEDRPYALSITDNPALLISLEGEDDLVVDVPANETYLQRVYVTAPGGTPEAQAERTDFTLRLEDTTTGDSAEKETVFNGRDN
mgnify:CR=1 FL=1